MSDKSIIIIGAGIGGLSTGCYARMNGYSVRILEMHNVPGGVCTAWQRDGYTFDGCIHNLAGSSPDSPFHQIWQELGVLPATPIYHYPELVQAERLEGEPLIVYTQLDKLAAHMKRLAPEDASTIDEIISAARLFEKFDILGLAIGGPLGWLKALRILPALARYGGTTMEQFASRFTNPFLRQAFPTLIYDWPQQPMLVLLSFLGRSEVGDLAWPMGGSARFAHQIAERFVRLGGEITYGAHVESILAERGHATGVRLADGSEQHADIIVSNAYGYTTIFQMLGGAYVNSAIKAYYNAPEDRIEMGIHVSLGVARDLTGEPHAIVLPLDEPVTVAGEQRDHFYVHLFGHDSSIAAPGRSVIKVYFATSYQQWETLYAEPERYASEKASIVNTVAAKLEARFPGLREQIEVTDVATPMTTKRFTDNGHGFRTSWGRMLLAMVTGRRLSQTLPGLDNFYMVGQWAGLPGVPLVAAMGRDVVRCICRKDKNAFVTQ